MEKKGNDEIIELSKETNLANLKRELDMYTKNIELHEEMLVRLDQEEAAIKRRYEIMLEPDNFKIIKPVWQYETLEEYWDTIRVDVENRRRNDEHQIETTREQLHKTLGHQRESFESVKAELERLEQ